MSLNPEQIAAMNQITGMNKPTTPVQEQGQSRVAELQAIAKQAQPSKPFDEIGKKSLGAIQAALPVAGAIGGGILGGMAGGAVASPTVFGIPAGVIAGGAAGAGIGASAGEAAKQGLEKAEGTRQQMSGGDIAKTGLEYGALEMVGGPAASLVGKGLMAGGETAAKLFIPTNAKEAALMQGYKAANPFWDRVTNLFTGGGEKAPTTMAQTAFDKGLMGTETGIGIRADRAATKLWDDAISPALKQSKQKVDMASFFKEAEQQIIRDNPELGRQKALREALDAVKSDYKGKKTMTMEQLQDLKKGWAKFVPQKAYRGKDIAGATNDVNNILADTARQKIYDAVGDNVKQAYIDYGNLLGLQELGQRSMTGGKLKGGFGSFWSAIKDTALVPSGTIGGQTVYKAGQGVEFLGKPGARTIRDLLGIPLGFGDTGGQSSDENQMVPQSPLPPSSMNGSTPPTLPSV